jgi:primosomal protein N' (replication factor Y)
VKQPPAVCPECHGTDIQFRGFGTQRVEEELMECFPQASMIRMDLDTTTKKGSHDAILRKFSDGEADILLGTQMVAKGLDFSRVTLVGVISAETQLLLPDFRASERTFQLLTQVAGRAGRSSLAGEVIIQTYKPQHDSLKHVVTHDFKSFYEQELAFRKELSYPPFSRIALIEFKGVKEENVIQKAERFAAFLNKQNSQLITLGPAPAPLTKLKGLYRWHLVLKSSKANDPSGNRLHQTLQKAIVNFKAAPSGNTAPVNTIVDIDPAGMM